METTTTIRLVRNATLRINYAGHTILVDPLLAEKASLISALGVNVSPRVHLTMPINEIVEDVDCVLLTHNHPVFYDLCKHFMFFNIHSHAACVFVLPHGCCV